MFQVKLDPPKHVENNDWAQTTAIIKEDDEIIVLSDTIGCAFVLSWEEFEQLINAYTNIKNGKPPGGTEADGSSSHLLH